LKKTNGQLEKQSSRQLKTQTFPCRKTGFQQPAGRSRKMPMESFEAIKLSHIYCSWLHRGSWYFVGLHSVGFLKTLSGDSIEVLEKEESEYRTTSFVNKVLRFIHVLCHPWER
jgi:hypothetical protein